MSAVKPVKTERTHEENQERAYIAASRRSDRSLEARVESARRASEIHKRRTGRSLRVTEQDVVNEEMYEEEDDDLPMQYRRLTAHLQTQNSEFNRRYTAYVVNQVALRQSVVNAANGTMQPNGNASFMNPGLMQMPQQPFQGGMMPPQMYHSSPANYRQQPYPMPQNMQAMRQASHGRSPSVPTSQSMSQYQHHYSQSAQTSPVDAKPMDDKRMSLPGQSAMPQTPVSQHGLVQSPAHVSPTISRNGSSTNLASPHIKSESPRQAPTPQEMQQQQQAQPQPARQQSLTSPFDPSFESQLNAGIDPFSMQLPMNAQQALIDGPSAFQMPSQMFTQPNYSYNPNGKPKGSMMQQGPDLSQTLMPSSLDTTFTGFDPSNMMTPQSAVTDPGFHFTPQTPQGWGFGFNQDPNQDLFKGPVDFLDGSGQITPHDDDWMNNFVQGDNSSQEELFQL